MPDLRASSFIGNDFFNEVMLNGAMKDTQWRHSRQCSGRRANPGVPDQAGKRGQIVRREAIVR